MYQPIRRWRAVVVGVAFGLACQHAAFVSAGIVAPASSDPSDTSEVAPAQPHLTDAAAPAASLTGANDAEPFWYPGADGASGTPSISSIPVQSNDDANVGGLHGLQQHPLIPLPGAAWTGMAGLLGLGAVKLLRNARRLLA